MSRFKVTLSTSLTEQLKLNPLFFLKFKPDHYYSYRDNKDIDTSKWISVDKELNISLDAESVNLKSSDYHLCIVELETQTDHKGDYGIIEHLKDYYAHIVSIQNANDLQQVFKAYIYQAQRAEHKYAFVEFLWLLNSQEINASALRNAIAQNDSNSIQWICSGLVDFGRCLPVKKQRLLKNIAESFGRTYTIYDPQIIQDALDRIGENWRYNQSDKNLYEAVNIILESITPDQEIAKGNKLLELKRWFLNDEPFSDYSYLVNLFSFVPEDIRLDIVKRWFHDIRLGNTSFDKDLLLQFKDNKFDNFIRFRYCIETPREPIVLTVPLLADNILTLCNSEGKAFQSFDGVLDFAITHCDTSHPAIDFQMERFIPRCDGGTKYNEDFVGFIDYAIIRKLDEAKLTSSYVLPIMKRLLDQYAQRKPYNACKWGDGSPLNVEQSQKCLHKINISKKGAFNNKTLQLECCETRHYEDKWVISKKNDIDFNIFLKEPIYLSNENVDIDVSMLSPETFIDFIKLIPTKFTRLDDGSFVVPSYRNVTLLLYLVQIFSTPLRMRIIPNKNVFAGLSFDIFKIKKNLLMQEGIDDYSKISQEKKKSIETEYRELESKEVHKRIIKSLKAKYNLGNYNDSENYFETEIDRALLDDIKNNFYFKEGVKENTPENRRNFLTINIQRFKPFCSPVIANANNEILDFPFFWCIGNECFHNCLDKQMLDDVNSWEKYSLYHLIEIIGYKKIHSTIAGNEPDESVRQFIAVSNKALKKFRRLKCRSCGHLLFADRGIYFQRNNHYACANPSCSEYHISVYLNYCYKCKTGLIDSRDSEQCPNGWYICPDCLSCCDDELYERQAQRYIIDHRQVPKYIQEKRGKGHNNKDIHFCPKCGTKIVLFQDDHGDYHHGCPKCRQQYNI